MVITLDTYVVFLVPVFFILLFKKIDVVIESIYRHYCYL